MNQSSVLIARRTLSISVAIIGISASVILWPAK